MPGQTIKLVVLKPMMRYSGIELPAGCSQYINEKHYSIDEVQMMTDHSRRESVMRYASVQLEEKRRLLEGK